MIFSVPRLKIITHTYIIEIRKTYNHRELVPYSLNPLINCIIIQFAWVNHWHCFWRFISVIRMESSDCSWWLPYSRSWLFSKFDDKHCNMPQPIRLVNFHCGPQSCAWLWKWQEVLIKSSVFWIEMWQLANRLWGEKRHNDCHWKQ